MAFQDICIKLFFKHLKNYKCHIDKRNENMI